MPEMTSLELCEFIAEVAHRARGQKRANGVTPFIEHPRHVVRLLNEWRRHAREGDAIYDSWEFYYAQCAAWLHDVVEDTKLTLEDLNRYLMCERIVTLVDLLTKKTPADRQEDLAYFDRLCTDETARVIKCADRCANLDDVIADAQRMMRVQRRWVKYVASTRELVLPLYEAKMARSSFDIQLFAELQVRVETIERLHALYAENENLNPTKTIPPPWDQRIGCERP